MGRKYKIHNSDRLYFVTFTVVEWIPVFNDLNNIDIILESIQHNQKNKGLEVYAWVIMPNHLHMIIGRNGERSLSDIIRDFKSFTSNQIRHNLLKDSSSLKYQILALNGMKNSRNIDFQLWQQHSHPIEISSDYLFDQKADYIHANPVEAGLVEFPEDWKWSSAIDFDGGEGIIELTWT
ncbi:MAG: transposase [Bacteroidota bacterium]